MHLLRKVVRKSVRKVTPRPVRQVNRIVRHPVLTTYQTVAPRPIRSAERSVYNITHPVNAVENKAVNAVIGPPIRWGPRKTTRRSSPARAQPAQQSAPDRPDSAAGSFAVPDHVESIYDEARRLADTAAPSGRARLIEAMDHEDPTIRKIAVRGIGRLNDPLDNPLLVAALRDPSDDVRIEAAHAVCARPPDEFRDALTQALDDTQPRVRELAADALARLGADQEALVEASDRLTAPEPIEDKAEDVDPPDLILALKVDAHHGEMVLSVRELLELLGRKRVTDAALDDIEDALEDAGLRCSPKVDRLEISGEVRLTRKEVIPEFALRAHVDASGEWTLPVSDLLRSFDRWRLTDRSRAEILEALEYADLTTNPSIWDVESNDQITVRRAPEG